MLGVSTSSAGMKQLYYVAGKTLRLERCQLSDTTIYKLMFIRSNNKYSLRVNKDKQSLANLFQITSLRFLSSSAMASHGSGDLGVSVSGPMKTFCKVTAILKRHSTLQYHKCLWLIWFPFLLSRSNIHHQLQQWPLLFTINKFKQIDQLASNCNFFFWYIFQSYSKDLFTNYLDNLILDCF